MPRERQFMSTVQQRIFAFNSDTTGVEIPEALNNPFGLDLPEIAKVAVGEFQEFITREAPNWNYDFQANRGKMFGVLVVRNGDEIGYMATVSGKLPGGVECDSLVPLVFDESTDDFYFHKGMQGLTKMGERIKEAQPDEIQALKTKRRETSVALQRWLFEQYDFVNVHGSSKNVLDIFEDAGKGKPAAATGDCAAPKLLNYALKHDLVPIALAEFWWGLPPLDMEREHLHFYPACTKRCRPVLEFMLDDQMLYYKASR